MMRRIQFIYRYFTRSRRWRRWFNLQNGVMFGLSVIFLTTLAVTAPLSISMAGPAAALQATPTPNPAAVGPTPTPMPADFLNNSNQTIGITLVGSVLVLIVVVGVLAFLPRKEESGR